MNEKLEKLNQEIEKTEARLRRAQHKEKMLEHQIKTLNRKERTHRLCTRGAMLESHLPHPESVTDGQVSTILKVLFCQLPLCGLAARKSFRKPIPSNKLKLYNSASHKSQFVKERYKMYIRKAIIDDLSRVAEIYVFNNRINFFPIFKDESFSFGELQVVSLVDNYFKKDEIIKNIYVFDDGLVKGFIQMDGTEICKLYVDTSFQSEGIGNELIEFAIKELHANNLWALEKNIRAISFYQRHGFHLTGQKKLEEDTTEYLVKLER